MTSLASPISARFAAHTAGLALAVFLIGLTASADGDIFWHLAAGRWMWTERALLTVDPFSSGAGGRPWTDVHWLFQLGVYAVHALGGLRALVVLKALLVALGAVVLALAVRVRAGERPALLFALLASGSLFAAREFLLLRPVIVSLLMLAAFFFVLERFRRDSRWVVLAPLPLLQIVWSNAQGLAPLGVGLVLAYAAAFLLAARFGRGSWFPFAPETKEPGASGALRLLAAGAAVAIASAITPYGSSALALPWRLLGRLVPKEDGLYALNIVENVPPLALDPALNGQFWHLKWFLAVALLAVALSFRRLVLSQLLVFAALLGLALMANRNLLLLYWLGAPMIASWLSTPLRRASLWLRMSSARAGAAWAGRAALLAVTLLSGVVAAREPDLGAPAPFRVPAKSAELLRTLPPGSVFAADHYGGYLIWSLFPAQRPYMDTRLVLRSADEFREFLAVVDEPQRFDDFEKRHGFGAVVLPVAFPDRYLPLIAYLYRHPRWKLSYSDGSETLFVPREGSADRGMALGDATTLRSILAELDERFAGEPRAKSAARRSLAALSLSLFEFESAELSLSGDESVEAEALRARARLLRGDTKGAEERAKRLLAQHPDDPSSLNLLALASLERGDRGRALAFLRRAAGASPFDAETEALLRKLEVSEHDPSP
jgi:hypothetical protein